MEHLLPTTTGDTYDSIDAEPVSPLKPSSLTVSGQIRPAGAASHRPAAPARVISSESLLGRSREILILHNSRLYRLRVTMSGKLVLTA